MVNVLSCQGEYSKSYVQQWTFLYYKPTNVFSDIFFPCSIYLPLSCHSILNIIVI